MSSFDSPFSEHIRTNYIPSTREKEHISQLLVDPQYKVSVLDAEIVELQKKFDEIKAKRDALDNAIVEHRRLLSPVRRVPDNILKTIFLNCLPTEGNAPMTIHEAPLLLGYVCRRWRDVAFASPSLWATLHIGYIPPSIYSLPTPEFIAQEDPISAQVQLHLHAVLMWLSRSGTCPISISIHPFIGGVNFRLYLRILSLFSHRWFSMELAANHESAVLDLASMPSEDFPMLEVLNLTFGNWMGTDPELQWKIQTGIINAQNLRSVTVHYFPVDLAVMNIDWSHLTSLILCDSTSAARKSTPDEAYRILTHCKHLIHLTMAIYDSSPTGVWFPPSHIYLPHLKLFSVNDHYYSLATLFACIDAPSLDHVLYSTQYWPSFLRRSPLVALLSRNGQSVRNLTIDPRYLSLDDLLDCLTMTPFLSKLSCKPSRLYASQEQHFGQQQTPIMSNIMKPIFQLLVPTNDGQCYWPRIQSVECLIYGLNDQDVLTFIRKRMEAPALLKYTLEVLPLNEVTISFGCEKKMDLMALLEEYTRDGLRLDFRDHWEIHEASVASPGRFDPRAGIKNNTFIPF